MTDKLIIQAIGPWRDKYEQVISLTSQTARRYAGACGADYNLFVGRKDDEVHLSWNRVRLILDAFTLGYRKVVWLDVDTLVIKPDVSIFDATSDVPFHSIRIPRPDNDGFLENDGVLVATNTPEAVEALESFWAKRHEPKAGWEQGWFDDYVAAHPADHAALDPRFNWYDHAGNITETIFPAYPPLDAAVILAWHAYEMEGVVGNRITQMRRAFLRYWPGE